MPIALVMILAGAICMLVLPIAQYPLLMPPQVQVSTQYIGAGADVAASTVTTPLEEKVYFISFQINPTTDTVLVRGTIANKKDQGQWVIKNGLKKGEKVIVEGTQKVRPGLVVNAKTYSAKKTSSG